MDIKRVNVFFVMLLFSFSSCSSGINYSSYIESDCDVRKDFIFIETANLNKEDGKKTERNFQFEKKGIALRIYPVYYALDYSDVMSIHYILLSKNKSEGLMSLKVKKDNNHYYETLGVVTQECVSKLSEYLESIDVKIPILDKK